VAEEARVPRLPLVYDTPAAVRVSGEGGEAEEGEGGAWAAAAEEEGGGEGAAGVAPVAEGPGRKRARAAPAATAAAAVFAPTHLPGCGITLSGLPTSAWDTLAKLDAIAARNAPLQPAEKPAEAPFFLPTTGGLNPTFVKPPEGGSSAGGSRVGRRSSATAAAAAAAPASRLCALLAREAPHADVAALLAQLPPAGVELELRSLWRPGGGGANLRAMLRCLTEWLRGGASYDLGTAYTQRTLALHAEELRGEDFAAPLAELAAAQGGGAARLNELLDGALGRVNFFLGT
jgi:hypothetical protein